MSKYLTREGDILEARSKKELVEKLRSYTSFEQDTELNAYMRSYADRVKTIFGKTIDTGSCDLFVTDLLKKKIIKKLTASDTKKYQKK